MGFDGPRVDDWNLFTVTTQVRQKLRATWKTKHSCQRALYSKKKAGNVECHQSLCGQNVCSFFRIAFELELFLLFNLANKILQAKDLFVQNFIKYAPDENFETMDLLDNEDTSFIRKFSAQMIRTAKYYEGGSFFTKSYDLVKQNFNTKNSENEGFNHR